MSLESVCCPDVCSETSMDIPSQHLYLTPNILPIIVEYVVQEQSKEPNLYSQVNDLTTSLQCHVCLHLLVPAYRLMLCQTAHGYKRGPQHLGLVRASPWGKEVGVTCKNGTFLRKWCIYGRVQVVGWPQYRGTGSG